MKLAPSVHPNLHFQTRLSTCHTETNTSTTADPPPPLPPPPPPLCTNPRGSEELKREDCFGERKLKEDVNKMEEEEMEEKEEEEGEVEDGQREEENMEQEALKVAEMREEKKQRENSDEEEEVKNEAGSSGGGMEHFTIPVEGLPEAMQCRPSVAGASSPTSLPLSPIPLSPHPHHTGNFRHFSHHLANLPQLTKSDFFLPDRSFGELKLRKLQIRYPLRGNPGCVGGRLTSTSFISEGVGGTAAGNWGRGEIASCRTSGALFLEGPRPQSCDVPYTVSGDRRTLTSAKKPLPQQSPGCPLTCSMTVLRREGDRGGGGEEGGGGGGRRGEGGGGGGGEGGVQLKSACHCKQLPISGYVRH